ncbi:hypothetical protein [Moorena sp. SIO3I8]|uniref:hypothetical protein n=1 Tax=Moorena sp. SIO3I8 TaxID=2607833 RepID=UPI0025E5E969|nr:hypothetical protein [Moorena sp. SIO3I8]
MGLLCVFIHKTCQNYIGSFSSAEDILGTETLKDFFRFSHFKEEIMKRVAMFFMSLMAALVLIATPAYAVTIQTGMINLNSSGPAETTNGDTSTFTEVLFPTPFPEGSDVIVIPMVQTFNGADTPGVRIADVTTESFKFRMNELVRGGPRQALSDGPHTTETIGWIAIGE